MKILNYIIEDFKSMDPLNSTLVLAFLIMITTGALLAYFSHRENQPAVDFLAGLRVVLISILFVRGMCIKILSNFSIITLPGEEASIARGIILLPLLLVTIFFSILLFITRIINTTLITSLYKKNIKFQERLNPYLYFFRNLVYWTTYPIYRDYWEEIKLFTFWLFVFLLYTLGFVNTINCFLALVLSVYFFLASIHSIMQHFDANVYLTPEIVSAYDKKLNKLRLSNFYLVVGGGGDEEIPPLNINRGPSSSGSGSSSTSSSTASTATSEANKTSGSTAAPEGAPKPTSRFAKYTKIANINEMMNKSSGGKANLWLIGGGICIICFNYWLHIINVNEIGVQKDASLEVENVRHNNQLNEDATKIDKELQMEDRRHNNKLNEIEAETKAQKEIIDYQYSTAAKFELAKKFARYQSRQRSSKNPGSSPGSTAASDSNKPGNSSSSSSTGEKK
jgi:hypothetical protein